MKIISIKLPEAYVEMLDHLVAEKVFETRSDAIRTAIKKLLIEMGKMSGEKNDSRSSSSFPSSETNMQVNLKME